MIEAAFDIDAMDRFPRVVPDGAVVHDAFPLEPIPERLKPALNDVLGQLALASTPYSGRRIACVLAGEDEGFGGHVIERTPSDIVDPFMMALRQVPPGDKLYGIMVTGNGPMKEKHVLPSGQAYDAVAERLLPGAPIVVVPPNQVEVCRFIPHAAHEAAYRPKQLSEFTGRTVTEIFSEAMRHTSLSAEDGLFIAQLRLAGLETGIQYYLTGSANGQSGPSVALRPGMYRDLDLIAVSDRPAEDVEAEFKAVAEQTYGALDSYAKIVDVAGSDRQVVGSVIVGLQAGITIDFYVASDLRDAAVRPDTWLRNYFHKLS